MAKDERVTRFSVSLPDALLAELQSGRFQAALDVFDEEPLPEAPPSIQNPQKRVSNASRTRSISVSV